MWRFDSGQRFSLYQQSRVTAFCDTGWGVAASYNNNIVIIPYWGAATNHEYGIHDPTIYPNFHIWQVYVDVEDMEFKTGGRVENAHAHKTYTIDVGMFVKHLVFWKDRLYVFFTYTESAPGRDEYADFNRVMILNAFTGEVITPTTVIPGSRFVCKPQILNGKLWLTTTGQPANVNDGQSLVSLDPYTFKELTRVEIPARKQERPHRFLLVDNWLIVDLFNDNSVAKFDATTGELISTIFVNRKPLSMCYNSDNKLIVASYSGTLSQVDLDTEEVTHLTEVGAEGIGGVVDTGRYIWVGTTGGLVRFDKTLEENNLIAQVADDDSEDYGGSASIEGINQAPDDGSWMSYNIREIIASEPFTYQAWNGSSFDEYSRKRYLLIRVDHDIAMMRDVPLWREYYNEVLGTAMISTGDTEYYGETE